MTLASCSRLYRPSASDLTGPLAAAEQKPIQLQLNEHLEKVSTFTVLLDATAEKFPGKERFREKVIFSAEHGVRIEVFDPALNRLLALGVARQGELRMLDLQKREFVVGAANAESFSELTSVPLDAASFALLLVGVVTPPPTATYARQLDTGHVMISWSIGATRRAEAILSGGKNVRLQRFQIFEVESGRLDLEASFQDDQPDGDSLGDFPHVIRFELPQRHIRLTAEILSINPKVSLPSELFELAIPDSFTERHIAR